MNKSVNHHRSLAHFAAETGNVEILQKILKISSANNPKDANGITPLHLAAQNGNINCCKLILQSSKNKYPQDKYGNTPLDFALQNYNFSILMAWPVLKTAHFYAFSRFV